MDCSICHHQCTLCIAGCCGCTAMAQPAHPVLQNQLQRHAQQQLTQLLQLVQPQSGVHSVLAAGICDHGYRTGYCAHHHLPLLLDCARGCGHTLQAQVQAVWAARTTIQFHAGCGVWQQSSSPWGVGTRTGSGYSGIQHTHADCCHRATQQRRHVSNGRSSCSWRSTSALLVRCKLHPSNTRHGTDRAAHASSRSTRGVYTTLSSAGASVPTAACSSSCRQQCCVRSACQRCPSTSSKWCSCRQAVRGGRTCRGCCRSSSWCSGGGWSWNSAGIRAAAASVTRTSCGRHAVMANSNRLSGNKARSITAASSEGIMCHSNGSWGST